MKCDGIIKIRRLTIVLILLLIFGLPIGLYAVSNIMMGQVGRPIYLLTITGSGNGTGIITSNIYGINCTSTAGVESGVCSVQIPMGTTIILTATPNALNIFSGWTGSGCLGIGTCTILIDGNKTVDANFTTIAGIPGLYAWFRYNEGAGTTIIDYSPVAVNGALNTGFGDPTAKFWSVAGFGHNDTTGILTWVLGTGRPLVNSTYVSMVGFIKPRGADPGPWTLASGAMWLGVGGATNWMKLGWNMAPAPYYWAMANGNITPDTVVSTTLATFNVWHFVYMYSDTVANVTNLYTRLSGGALTLVASAPHTAGNIGDIATVLSFGGNNKNYVMDGGDMLWWAAADSSGVISITTANAIYESLKSRHGML